jgi:hypothetical protein
MDGLRCADRRDILNSTIGAGPNRTEQIVSDPGRGVLAYHPMGSTPCDRDLSEPHTQSAGRILGRNSGPYNTAEVHSAGVCAVL